MRILVITIMLILCSLVVSASAVETICPFPSPTPQNFPVGSFSLNKQIASSGTGTFIGMESTGYSDKLSQNVYSSEVLAAGSTDYSSTLNIGSAVTSTKAISFLGGSLSTSELYGQVAISPSNLSFCDMLIGGSTTSLNSGQVVSNTNLTAPVWMSYDIGVSGTDNDNAIGMASVFMDASSMEGINSTRIDRQTMSQNYMWTGDFSFAVSDSLRITHPINANYNKIVAAMNQTQLC